MKDLEKLIPPINIKVHVKYDLKPPHKKIILSLVGRKLYINEIITATEYTFEKTRTYMRSLIQYGLVDTHLYHNKTMFKLTLKGDHVAAQLLKLDILNKNGLKNNKSVSISKNKFNILKMLKDNPLSYDQLSYMVHESPEQLLNSLKFLQLVDLVYTDSIEDSFTQKILGTVYVLTPKGDEIVTHVLSIKHRAGLNISPKFHNRFINGTEFTSKKQLIKYLATMLSSYEVGEFLSVEHSKLITDCLRATERGVTLIPYLAKIRVVTDTDCIALVYYDGIEQTIRVHGILDDWQKYHKDEVRFAFRGELVQTYEHVEGISRYHEGLTFNDLVVNFLKSKELSFDEIEIHRVNDHLRLVNRDLASDWLSYHTEYAKILLLTDEEMSTKLRIDNLLPKSQPDLNEING